MGVSLLTFSAATGLNSKRQQRGCRLTASAGQQQQQHRGSAVVELVCVGTMVVGLRSVSGCQCAPDNRETPGDSYTRMSSHCHDSKSTNGRQHDSHVAARSCSQHDVRLPPAASTTRQLPPLWCAAPDIRTSMEPPAGHNLSLSARAPKLQETTTNYPGALARGLKRKK
ncbi:hypothetical protein C0Q70_10234 [Pomacea canaliculata]|uniref:Uncharacterized protein n=1 Tax=Pomacea canaliculata TaxID=400727 RepID=A0A2T7PC17_POMCA|nr:hypothetical protein C0Q70_10234 [Pomacea canaliculata]